MTIKLSAFFTLGNGGFSETFFREGSTTNDALNAWKAVLTQRMTFASPQVTLIGIRASIVENPAVVQAEKSSLVGSWSSGRDYLNAAVYFPATAGLNIKRNIFTRGVPDTQVTGGVYAPTSGYQLATQNWATAVTFNGMCIRSQDKDTYALQQVFSISGTGLLTTNLDPGWQNGQKIKFFRAVDTLGKPVKRIYTIQQRLTPLTFQLLEWEPGRLLSGRLARRFVLRNVVISNISTGVATTRRTGRPFALPVGRRRVAR